MSEKGRSVLAVSQKARLEQAWSSGLKSIGRDNAPQITLLAEGKSQGKSSFNKQFVVYNIVELFIFLDVKIKPN